MLLISTSKSRQVDKSSLRISEFWGGVQHVLSVPEGTECIRFVTDTASRGHSAVVDEAC